MKKYRDLSLSFRTIMTPGPVERHQVPLPAGDAVQAALDVYKGAEL
ncbi:hypothetical protein LJK87_10815 [Paenibacillus sp. P25]|nr:hypothetical protein LJK87_10815 [Paenibacillus sp. P25]